MLLNLDIKLSLGSDFSSLLQVFNNVIKLKQVRLWHFLNFINYHFTTAHFDQLLLIFINKLTSENNFASSVFVNDVQLALI